jgi:hypothetical protein
MLARLLVVAADPESVVPISRLAPIKCPACGSIARLIVCEIVSALPTHNGEICTYECVSCATTTRVKFEDAA